MCERNMSKGVLFVFITTRGTTHSVEETQFFKKNKKPMLSHVTCHIFEYPATYVAFQEQKLAICQHVNRSQNVKKNMDERHISHYENKKEHTQHYRCSDNSLSLYIHHLRPVQVSSTFAIKAESFEYNIFTTESHHGSDSQGNCESSDAAKGIKIRSHGNYRDGNRCKTSQGTR